jgi:diguanylate cyclase (GGDEF)-like protein
LLTARDAKEHMVAGLEAGADDYLIKPVYEPELLARLNTGRRILALEYSLRLANERNRVLSITDPLTRTFNRRQLMDQLPREMQRARRYAYPFTLIMCDIDHFKVVNDVHGHAVGDEVLQQFVTRINKSIRASSDWVARYGGEEFIIVLPDTNHEGGRIVAEKIRQRIAATPFDTEAGPVQMTASFGVAATPPTGPSLGMGVEVQIAVADACLYRSKRDGRNLVHSMEMGSGALEPDQILRVGENLSGNR